MGQRYGQLSLEERISIARFRDEGRSLRQIAASLDRAPSTISRELRRNSGRQIGYRAGHAQERAWARRWRGSKLARQPPLGQAVIDRLAMGWSPQQIAGRLALEHGSTVVSYETIYRFIYAQIRRTKDYGWRLLLPRGKAKRRPRRSSRGRLAMMPGGIPIARRPAHILQRKQAGHWEADLLHPAKSGPAILVAQERQTRFTFMAKVPGKRASPIVDVLADWFAALPAQIRRSVTQDNGTEFRLLHHLAPLGIKTYFCDAHSPWQKGGVENMNGRIRRFIPRGTDPASITEDDVRLLAAILNSTPRKILGYRTPQELFSKKLLHFKCESTFPPSRE